MIAIDFMFGIDPTKHYASPNSRKLIPGLLA
jgi:hypothetical protein